MMPHADDPRPSFRHVTILGVGLLGASLALAMRREGLADTIIGFGRRQTALEKAREQGIIDDFSLDAAEACRGADLILFATPPGSFPQIAGRIAPSLGKGAIVTDVGSVKGPLVSLLEQAVPEGAFFVGSHPIAGSDRSGMEHADADLFVGARCILTPTERTDPDAARAVASLWRTLGAEVVTMSPDEHDRIYAAVSHFPHLIAYSVMTTVGEANRDAIDLCGSGFRDLTRIAASPAGLWTDISLMNREHILPVLDLFLQRLTALRAVLAAGDADSLRQEFEEARILRESIG